MAKEFRYEVKKDCGIIAEHNRDTIRLRLISYGGREPKYDIRTWFEDKDGEEGMGKGVTLTKDELQMPHDIIEYELKS